MGATRGDLATVVPIRTHATVMATVAGLSPTVRAFLEFKRGENRSVRTVRSYRSVLTRLECATGGDLLSAGWQDIAGWLDDIGLDGPDKAASRATYLTAIRSFYKWAQIMDLVVANPVDRVPSPRLPRRGARPIGRAQFQHVVAHADGELRLWLLLAGTAGLRRSEVCYLHAEDVMHGEIRIFVHRGTKGGHTRWVPLHPKLALYLAEWHVSSGRLWHRHPSTVGDRVAAHMRAHGVDATCHQLRHYFGTEYLRATGDIMRVQRAMGHQSPATTQMYTAVIEEDGGAVASIAA